MRILFIIDSLGSGGAERQLIILLEGLVARFLDVHLICFTELANKNTQSVIDLGIPITYFQRKTKYDFRIISKVTKYVRDENIDVLHSFNNLGSFVGLFASKLASRPIVCSAIRDAKDKNWKYKYSKILFALFSNILVSNSEAGFTNRFSRRWSNFRVVYNGADTDRIKPIALQSKHLLRENLKLGVDIRVPWIGMIASLTDHKDHVTFLKAISLVLAHQPNIQAIIVGEGPMRPSLVVLAEELGISESVHFLGHREDSIQIGGLMDVVLLLSNPSTHQEGISNSLTEAMMQAVPVIASLGGGTDELLDHGNAGILVSPGQPEICALKLIELINEPQGAVTIGRNARNRIENVFGINRYIDEYISIYKYFHN